jgi:hemolysin III
MFVGDMTAFSPKSSTLLAFEDRANLLTHAIGVGICLGGLALMVAIAAATGDPWKIVSASIFGATLVQLYVSSMLYHAATLPSVKRKLRAWDHISIYFLIAGTYTPFLLVNLRGHWGWPLFGVMWALAIGGLVKDVFLTGRSKILSTLLYILMGWIIVVVMRPLAASLTTSAFVLLFVGGGAYSLGAVFYVLDKKIPFGHAIWHLFVLGASVCHVLAVILGVLRG